MARRILIAGCGYVGAALAERLCVDGNAVWGLRREAGLVPACAEPISGDVCDPKTLSHLPYELDAVVYAVAAGEYSEARYRAVYVDGPRNLLDALAKCSPKLSRFVLVSSTGVYAQDNGEWVDEESPAEQTHFSGAALLEGERLIQAAGVPATVVRFGGIYGPGRTRLIDSVRAGTATVPAEPNYINLVHRDDCAGILRHVLTMRNPAALYLGVDCKPVDRRELLSWIALRTGAPAPRVDDSACSARSLRGNKRCSNRRIRAAGYRFKYATYRDGYGDLCAAMPRG